MIENLKELQKLAGKNARKHGWLVIWNRDEACVASMYKYALTPNNFPKDGKVLTVGEALALIHSETSEALDDQRNDNKEHFGEELADIVIRVLHLANDLDIDLTSEINKKMEKNKTRPINHGRKHY